MAHIADDDLDNLATRLRLGIPLTGFDGMAIPLCHPDGREVDPMEAALLLLRSSVASLGTDGDDYLECALWRARAIEAEAIVAGETSAIATAKATAVLVCAAVRAAVLTDTCTASPSDLNRATLTWYQVHDEQRRRLLDAHASFEDPRLSA